VFTPARTASTSLHRAAQRGLELLDDDEIKVLLAHELGHVMSGHALYRTIAEILLLVSLGALPFLAGIAILPIRLAISSVPEVRTLQRSGGLLGVRIRSWRSGCT